MKQVFQGGEPPRRVPNIQFPQEKASPIKRTIIIIVAAVLLGILATAIIAP